MAYKDRYEHSEDLFADTRMSFGDHIEELRRHMLRAIYGFTVALVVAFFVSRYLLALIQEPLRAQLHQFHMQEVEKTLRNRDNNPDLQKENRPFWIGVTLLRSELGSSAGRADGSAALRPLPDNAKPPSADELADRGQRQLIAAREALELRHWDRLRELAPVIEQTAGLLDPSSAQSTAASKTLAGSAGMLEKSAKDEDFEAANAALAGIEAALGDRGLAHLSLRIDHPVELVSGLYGAQQIIDNRDKLISTTITESLFTYLKVSIVCALVLGSPWIFYQLWSFVAAGLYPHEKRYVNLYLPVSIGLFLGGVLLAQFIVMPRVIAVLLWFNYWLGQEPMLRINDWLNFALLLPILTGASFQLPLVMLFLERIGLFTVSNYIHQWKIALFGVHLIAAIGPSVDPISMEMVAIPMFGLYWFGILLCHWHRDDGGRDEDVPESHEMVEV